MAEHGTIKKQARWCHMKNDYEVKLYMSERRKGVSQKQAAARAGMSERTARKYEQAGALPSALKRPHAWQTRSNPYEEDCPWVVQQLERDPALQSTTLFALLCERHPDRYRPTQDRTLRRHIARWRVLHGPAKEVIFEKSLWQIGGVLSLTLITGRTGIRSASRAASRFPAGERASTAPSWRRSWPAPRSPGTIVGPGAARSYRAVQPDQSVAACRDGYRRRLRGRATRWPGTAATAAAPDARGRGYGSFVAQSLGSYYPGSALPPACARDSDADSAVRLPHRK